MHCFNVHFLHEPGSARFCSCTHSEGNHHLHFNGCFLGLSHLPWSSSSTCSRRKPLRSGRGLFIGRMPFLSLVDSVKALAPVRKINHRLVLSFIEPAAHSSAKIHSPLCWLRKRTFGYSGCRFLQAGCSPCYLASIVIAPNGMDALRSIVWNRRMLCASFSVLDNMVCLVRCWHQQVVLMVCQSVRSVSGTWNTWSSSEL